MFNLVLLEGIYLFVTVFAVGVTAIESMGLLGDHGDDDGGGGHDGADGDTAGHATGHHAGDAQQNSGDPTDSAEGQEGVVTRGDLVPRRPNAERYIFKTLAILRVTVYFGLGFGPMGLIAVVLGAGVPWSIILAIVAGLATSVLYRSFIRWQQQDLDSTVHDRDLVGHQANVLIAIYPNETGRVRIKLAQMICDRYATSDSNDFIPKGALVDVLASTPEGLVVAMPHEHV